MKMNSKQEKINDPQLIDNKGNNEKDIKEDQIGLPDSSRASTPHESDSIKQKNQNKEFDNFIDDELPSFSKNTKRVSPVSFYLTHAPTYSEVISRSLTLFIE